MEYDDDDDDEDDDDDDEVTSRSYFHYISPLQS
jgi:hypothetical protein